jgi:tetratricopeptide (TPR) repeat protein
MKDDFLIVQVHHPQNTGIGEFIYRLEQPATVMGSIPGVRVILASVYSWRLEELCRSADAVVWHMVTEQDLLPLMEWRKRRKLSNIYEISDMFLAFQPHDPMKEVFSDPIRLATTLQYIHLADAVQATTQELARTFGFLNPRIVVFENQMKGVHPIRRRSGEGMTIGWGGSLSHLADLAWIAPAITGFCRSHPEVHFSYMGNRKGLELFSAIPDPQFLITPGGTLEDYYGFLSTLDVGLAPLLDTPYNRCRSDVKFLEYGAAGAAPVLADLPPYRKHGECGRALLFSNKRELLELLSRLLADPLLRHEAADRAYRYVGSERVEERHGDRRLQFYKGLGRNKAGRSPKLPGGGVERIQEGCEAYRLKESSEEKSSMAMEGEALAQFLEEHTPGHYLPYLKAGEWFFHEGSPKAEHYLTLATVRGSESLRTRLLLAMALLQRDRGRSYNQLTQAIQISHRYAPAWDALARLREQEGDHQEAARMFMQALEANPFYSPGIVGLARAYLAIGKTEGAIEALRAARDLVPEHTEARAEFNQTVQQARNLVGPAHLEGLVDGLS